MFAGGDVQTETLANELRSSDLAWRVIQAMQRVAARGSAEKGNGRQPEPEAAKEGSEAQSDLLDNFQRHLKVRTLPRTLLVEIRFRSTDPLLATRVVNALIVEYQKRDGEERVAATSDAASLLDIQLAALKTQVDADERRLETFQRDHGLVDTPEQLGTGPSGEIQHNVALEEIDEVGKQLAAASADRILREAEYVEASKGNPESILASDPVLQAQGGTFSTAMFQQLHARHSDLEQEASQLGTEHGPNFPRTQEIRAQLADLDRQIALENAKLLARFKDAWSAASHREELVRKSLDELTRQGMRVNEAHAQYSAMRQEYDRSRELYLNLKARATEASLTSGISDSRITVVDPARQPVRPISPNWLLAIAITLFLSGWFAVFGALAADSWNRDFLKGVVPLIALMVLVAPVHGQAPTPSTSGLPTGVAHLPGSTVPEHRPDAKEGPLVWNNANPADSPASDTSPSPAFATPAAFGPGDTLSISEFATPEFRATVRLSDTGVATLPLLGDVPLAGLTESAAAKHLEDLLRDKGILLHPHVSVVALSQVGQDVTILGEVVRPGIYSVATHHRLLDLIAAASGLSANAGSLVTIEHRDKNVAPIAVTLEPQPVAATNPELLPGDTVQISRAGLAFVIGDVLRPGGFPINPTEHLTVLQTLALAWGPTANAALSRAVLIREQDGGRTITNLNLKRLMRGLDPDMPIRDKDILFIPDSAAKNLWNRTMESVVQSAAGVSVYAGMVYSQRF